MALYTEADRVFDRDTRRFLKAEPGRRSALRVRPGLVVVAVVVVVVVAAAVDDHATHATSS